MKSFAGRLLALWCASAAFGADPPSAEPQTAAQFAEAFTRLDREAEVKVNAVEAAILQAAESRVINVTTEAWELNQLAEFRIGVPRFPSGTGLPLRSINVASVPPVFDASPEMVPLNLAWAELRGAQLRYVNARLQLIRQLETAASTAFATAARAAVKPEDLDTARDLFELLEPYASIVETGNLALTTATTTARAALIGPMQMALRSAQADDALGMSRALGRLSAPDARPQLYGRPSVPDAGMLEFRERMFAPFARRLQEAQGALEKGLMARKAPAELDAVFARYLTATSEVRVLEEVFTLTDPRLRGAGGIPGRSPSPLPQESARMAYEEAFALLVSPGSAGTSGHPAETGKESFTFGDEFRAFLRVLRKEGRTTPPAPPPAASAALRPLLESVRREVAALHTARETLACADALRTSLETLQPEAGAGAETETLTALSEALRRLGEQWQDDALDPMAQELTPFPQPVPEWSELRQRALREQTARTLAAPELLRDPLRGQPLSEGLRQLAHTAGAQGEWRRAFTLLRGRRRLEADPLDETTPIHDYLAGRQLEEAELYRPAIASYRQVLSQVAEHTPVTEAAARLKALQAEHPELFRER